MAAPAHLITVSSWNELQERLYADSWRAPAAIPFAVRVSGPVRGWRAAAHGPVPAGPARARTRAPHAAQLPEVRAPAGRARRQPLELAGRGAAPRPADPAARLDVVAARRAALRHRALASYDRDGIVWCIDFAATNRLLPDRLRQLLAEEGADAFTAEMLTRVAATLAEFDALPRPSSSPFSSRRRSTSASSTSSRCSRSPRARSCGSTNGCDAAPGAVPACWFPAALKWEVRDKLDQANITERVLYRGWTACRGG